MRPVPSRRRSACSTARSSSASPPTSSPASTPPRASSARATSPRPPCSARSARPRSAARSRCAAGPGSACMATGGLGGVHRGWPTPPDVSADLQALARATVLVVSSGVKSLLDVPATAELLETLGVPVLGYRTDELPLFYAARGGPAVSARVESADEAARVAPRALGARRRRAAARPPARREPRRRRAADRAGARGCREPTASTGRR